MDNFNFKEISLNDLNGDSFLNSIVEITKIHHDLKLSMFRNKINQYDANKYMIEDYRKFLLDYFGKWTELTDELSKVIINVHPDVGHETVDFNLAKEFIYESYDYASILQFADGLVTGFKSGKFTKKEDINDFFDYVASKAYNHNLTSVGKVTDMVLPTGMNKDMFRPATNEDVQLFNKTKSAIAFPKSDIIELRSALIKTMEFLNTFNCSDKYRMNIYFYIFNKIFEYAELSCAIYSARIFIIHQYVIGYTNEKTITESAIVDPSENTLDVTDKNYGYFSSVMMNCNEMLCKNYTDYKKFINELFMFATTIGADVSDRLPDWEDDKNVFYNALKGNPLHQLISTTYTGDINDANTDYIKRFTNKIYNATHGLSSSQSAKQDYLISIKNTFIDDSFAGLQKLTKYLYEFAFNTLHHISVITKDYYRIKERGKYEFNTSGINDVDELFKIYKDLYTEIATTILYKARDIELRINKLKEKAVQRITDDMKIHIKSDIDMNHNTMSAVPDTTRNPDENDRIDVLYQLPKYESMELYDEYLRSLPIFESHPYFFEANGQPSAISKLFNFLLSRIASIFDRFKGFVSDKRFEDCRQHVINTSKTILNNNFTGLQLWVLPYKNKITLPEGFNNLANNLKQMDEKVLESKESRDNFIKSLYPSDAIYNWFHDPNTARSAAEMYRNHILFYDLDKTKKEVPTINYPTSGDALRKAISSWMDNIISAPDTTNEFERIKNDAQSGINHVKNIVAAYETKMINNDKEDNNDMPEMPKDDNKNDTSKTIPGKSKGPANSPNVSSTNPTKDPNTIPGKKTRPDQPSVSNEITNNEEFVNRIVIAFNRLYIPIGSILPECYRSQYQYVLAAEKIIADRDAKNQK